jgi:ferredoxin-NADP reductase
VSAHFSRILRRTRLSDSAFEVELERPSAFRFAPGQNVRLQIDGEARDYSLASAPFAETLVLLVRRIEGGAVSPVLCDAPTGTRLELTGPHGLFTFKPSDRPAVLAATGVGIAPFLSMVRAGVLADGLGRPASPPGGLTLLHGARLGQELFYREELNGSVGGYAPCVSRDEAPGCFHGRVTDWSRAHLAPAGRDFYLCGSRQMTRDMVLLIDERFGGSFVYTEIFF